MNERDEQAKEIADQVLAEIRFYNGKPVSSHQIAREIGANERLTRAAIAVLRERGELIIADPGGGYRFARSYEDLTQFTSSLKSRIEALRQIVSRMETAGRREFKSDAQPRLF